MNVMLDARIVATSVHRRVAVIGNVAGRLGRISQLAAGDRSSARRQNTRHRVMAVGTITEEFYSAEGEQRRVKPCTSLHAGGPGADHVSPEPARKLGD